VQKIGIMLLSVFLAKKKQTPAEFAERLGVARFTLDRWLRGSSIPQRRLLRKIETVTGGAVRPADFYAASFPGRERS
jgi:transcriptional regulator with XRE-family HTH domain